MKLTDMKIGWRLGAAFAGILVMLASIVAIQVQGGIEAGRAQRQLTERLEEMGLVGQIIEGATSNMQRITEVLLSEDYGLLTTVQAEIDANRARNAVALERLKVLMTDADSSARLAKMQAARKRFIDQRGVILDLARNAKFAEGKARYDAELKPVVVAYKGELAAMYQHEQAGAQADIERIAAVNTRNSVLAGAGLALIALLTALTAWFITRSITVPLKKAVAVADAVARGDLTVPADPAGKDEVAQLQHAMGRMVATLRELSAGQLEMAERHEAGATGHRIDAARFQGSYREMAEQVNELAAAHIAVTMQLADVTMHYAKGDFSPEMPELPGEKAVITRSCAAARGNLLSMQEQIARLANAAACGDFTQRGDEARFEHGFADMVASLNRLMETADAGLTEASRTLDALARGELDARMDARFEGAFGALAQSANATATKLKAIVDQIGTLADAAAHGNFAERGDASGFQNGFAGMVTALNKLMQTADSGLRQATDALAEIAQGNLAARMDVRLEGAFGELAAGANTTASRLSDIVGRIREASAAIESASGEIAAGNSDLSSRTQQQAASLEETAASMEELTGTVKQNAENAKQANQLAVSASEVALEGGQVVGRVVATMGSITQSARKIEDIIGVIDDIAFQTNILALNAAVEAARAGDHGRGFAVVATEVRNLAQRSATAAKEIKGLIGTSVDEVNAGSKLVDQAGKTMDEVVKSVKRVADIVGEISAASMEQASGIEQVNLAITQMDQVTQQNAALVEEAAAAAESMREQAHGLTGAVSVFKTGADAPGETRREPVRLASVGGARPNAGPAARPARKAANGTRGPWTEI